MPHIPEVVSALPKRVDLQAHRGYGARFTLHITDPDGADVDIEDDTIEVTVYAEAGGEVKVGTLTLGDPDPHTSPSTGHSEFEWSASDLEDEAVAGTEIITWWWEAVRLIGGDAGQAVPWFHGRLQLFP